MRLACERHLRDLEQGRARGLRWNRDAAAYALNFFPRFLRHSKGEFARQPFVLAPWQQFIVGSVFGWQRRDEKLGWVRRFNVVYDEVARKNGKSTLCAGVGIYLLALDGEEGAEVYAAATKRDQARIIFSEARRMVLRSTQLLELVDVQKLNLSVPATYSHFEPLSSDEKTLDGLNPHGILVDELHKHKNRLLLDVLDTALGARSQPLLWIITTAGDTDPESVYAQEHHDARRLLEGMLEDDTKFVFIATLDEKDDPFDERNWPKANPNLGISVGLADFRRQAAAAKNSPGKKLSFLRLRLNVRTGSAELGIPAHVWLACGGAVDREKLRGRACKGGLDLSGKNDLTALVLRFDPLEGEPAPILPFFWVPEHDLELKAERDRAKYLEWAEQGHLFKTPGKVIDYDFVARKLGELAGEFDITEIAFDRWRIKDFIAACERQGVLVWEADPKGELDLPGIKLVPHGQGWKDMAPSWEATDDALLEAKIAHGGHPVLTWNASNLALEPNPAGDKKPTKRKSIGRIDGLVAMIMACGLAARAVVNPPVTVSADYSAV